MKYSPMYMGSSGGEGIMSFEGVWNISEGYTKIKILRPLIEWDLYENYAMFGKKDLDEQVSPELIPRIRAEALIRVFFTAMQTIGNCRFSIRIRKDKMMLGLLMQRLKNVEPYLDGIGTERRNEITKENILVINEIHFKNVFNIIREIKDELNTVLDNAGIIFRKGEEMDIDSVMRDIEEGA